MSLPIALAVYFLCWWVVFFAVLPLGAHSQAEAGAVIPGTDSGAPVVPRMGRKLLLTTGIATVVFVLVYAVIAWRIIPLNLFSSFI